MVVKVLEDLFFKLSEKFKNIEVQTQDIERGFNRPSFFIEVNRDKLENLNEHYLERDLEVTIFYFPSNKRKNQVELLEVEDKLIETFVKNRYIEIDGEKICEFSEFEFLIEEGILELTFETSILDEIDNKGVGEDKMEELEIGEDRYD